MEQLIQQLMDNICVEVVIITLIPHLPFQQVLTLGIVAALNQATKAKQEARKAIQLLQLALAQARQFLSPQLSKQVGHP